VSEPSPRDRATSAFDIDDIFLIAEEASVVHEFNQSDRRPQEILTLQRVRVEEKVLVQSRVPLNDPESAFLIARFLVVGEVYIGKPGIQPSDDGIKTEDQVARMIHTFAADYRVKDKQMPDQEALGSFITNVIYHVWPYWREAVHSQVARMRLPAITIPMMKMAKGAQGGAQFSAGGLPLAAPSDKKDETARH
jgi:hypothetical protein